MAGVKVQVVKGLGHLDVQLPIKERSTTVAWAAIFILLLVALSSLLYFVSFMPRAYECQAYYGADKETYAKAPGCGYMLFAPKNASRYVRYPHPSISSLKGDRCAFVIFSETKEVRVSYANYSFPPTSNAGVIVAELNDDEENQLKYSKLDRARALIAKSPFAIYYTSDVDRMDKQSSFVIEVSPVESSGSSTGFPGGASMVRYLNTGVMNRHYPRSASYPMAFLAMFQASPTSQPDRHFTCSPRNSTCCNAISLYRLPTFKLGDTASRLTGLSTGGVKVSSEVTVAMMFCLPSNFDASAGGSTCRLEWHAVNETTKEVGIGY